MPFWISAIDSIWSLFSQVLRLRLRKGLEYLQSISSDHKLSRVM